MFSLDTRTEKLSQTKQTNKWVAPSKRLWFTFVRMDKLMRQANRCHSIVSMQKWRSKMFAYKSNKRTAFLKWSFFQEYPSLSHILLSFKKKSYLLHFYSFFGLCNLGHGQGKVTKFSYASSYVFWRIIVFHIENKKRNTCLLPRMLQFSFVSCSNHH